MKIYLIGFLDKTYEENYYIISKPIQLSKFKASDNYVNWWN
ncbi:MAG: hypothetical protein WCI04_05710 [archaeon]